MVHCAHWNLSVVWTDPSIPSFQDHTPSLLLQVISAKSWGILSAFGWLNFHMNFRAVSQRKVVEAHVYESSQTYDWKGFFPLKPPQLVWAAEKAEWRSPHYMKTPEPRMTQAWRGFLLQSQWWLAHVHIPAHTHTHTHTQATMAVISCSKKGYWTRMKRVVK